MGACDLYPWIDDDAKGETGEEPEEESPPQDGPWVCASTGWTPREHSWYPCLSMQAQWINIVTDFIEGVQGMHVVVLPECTPLYTFDQEIALGNGSIQTLITVCAAHPDEPVNPVSESLWLYWHDYGPLPPHFDIPFDWPAALSYGGGDIMAMECPVGSGILCRSTEHSGLGQNCSCECDTDPDCTGQNFGELICNGDFGAGYCDSNNHPLEQSLELEAST